MCLAVPGKIESIEKNETNLIMGKVNFSGIIKSVCLDLVPEAVAGDYVLVHTGFAINLLDESEALETLNLMNNLYFASMEDGG